MLRNPRRANWETGILRGIGNYEIPRVFLGILPERAVAVSGIFPFPGSLWKRFGGIPANRSMRRCRSTRTERRRRFLRFPRFRAIPLRILRTPCGRRGKRLLSIRSGITVSQAFPKGLKGGRRTWLSEPGMKNRKLRRRFFSNRRPAEFPSGRESGAFRF